MPSFCCSSIIMACEKGFWRPELPADFVFRYRTDLKWIACRRCSRIISSILAISEAMLLDRYYGCLPKEVEVALRHAVFWCFIYWGSLAMCRTWAPQIHKGGFWQRIKPQTFLILSERTVSGKNIYEQLSKFSFLVLRFVLQSRLGQMPKHSCPCGRCAENHFFF